MGGQVLHGGVTIAMSLPCHASVSQFLLSAPDNYRLAASTRALGPPHAKTRPPLRKPPPPPRPYQLEPQPELHLDGKGALDGLEAKM